MKMGSEIIINSQCQEHGFELTHICRSPDCKGYRQICVKCIDQQHQIDHKPFHKLRSKAIEETKSLIGQLLNGLKGLNRKIVEQMQSSLNKNQGLDEVQQKLNQIKKLISDKIDEYKKQIKKMYSKQIKEKLHQLFQIVQKSRQFLEEQRIKLMNSINIDVRPFFLNDLNHQLAYYNSLFNQILQKNTRKFRARFDQDKILKLTVSFQQNLDQIFASEKNQNKGEEKLHAFFGHPKQGRIFSLLKEGQLTNTLIDKIPNAEKPKEDDKWEGIVASVYDLKNDCFYLFGQGSRESSKIVKYKNGLFKEIKNLSTKRANFAVCLMDQQIYIVGGQNLKQGCLVKCQKYAPISNKIYLMSSLNQRSSKHSLCNFKDKFLLKFGGIQFKNSKDQKKGLFGQIYEIESGQWKKINLSPETFKKIPISLGVFPTVFKSGDQIILLSQNSLRLNERNRYQIIIAEDTKEIKQVKINHSILKFPSSLKMLTSQSISQNKFYYLAYQENNQQYPIKVLQLKK